MPGRYWLGFENAEYRLHANGPKTLFTRITTISSHLHPAWPGSKSFFSRFGFFLLSLLTVVPRKPRQCRATRSGKSGMGSLLLIGKRVYDVRDSVKQKLHIAVHLLIRADAFIGCLQFFSCFDGFELMFPDTESLQYQEAINMDTENLTHGWSFDAFVPTS